MYPFRRRFAVRNSVSFIDRTKSLKAPAYEKRENRLHRRGKSASTYFPVRKPSRNLKWWSDRTLIELSMVPILLLFPQNLAQRKTASSTLRFRKNAVSTQSVGDTTGPGGIARAIRAIPVLANFANHIMDICPNAWVVNYTNPMAWCTAALFAAQPNIKAVGCCHEVFHTQEMLCKWVSGPSTLWCVLIRYASSSRYSVWTCANVVVQ